MKKFSVMILLLMMTGISAYSEILTPDEKLYEAVTNGNLKLVKSLLAKGADINTTGPNLNENLIHAAAGKGDLALVKFFVEEKHVDINLRQKDDSSTPLYWAVCVRKITEKNYQVARYLIENGADVNAANNYKHTAVFFAALGGHPELVQLLISKKADLNFASIFSETPLQFAVKSKSPRKLEVVKLLVENGADINYVNTSDKKRIIDYADGAVKEYLEGVLNQKKENSDVKSE